jgi:hypothetical protein
MKQYAFTLILIFLLGAALASAAKAQDASQPLGEQDAHAIGVDAYLYLYPLVTMDQTRKQLTNMEPGSGIGGPSNTFANVGTYPTADMKTVVRPNFDTLYSSAWLDLTREPMIVSVPDTNGRYYLLPMLDMWTDVFTSPGWRTTGTKAGNFVVVPPGWRPDLRERLAEEFRLPQDVQLIDAPTPHVWIIGRTQTNGPQDYDAVHKVQGGFKITPLTRWGRAQQPPTAVKIDPSIDMTTPPKIQVDAMSAAKFFSTAAEIMKQQPPHITDRPTMAALKRIGFEPGKSFDLEKADPTVKKALESAPEAGRKLMAWKLPTLARVANGWSMNTTTMGVYGNDYLRRAIIAQQGLGANLPQDAVYPVNFADDTGKPLDGGNKYTLHFDEGASPPVNAFWSVTLYDPDGYQVANPLHRFALSSWMPLKYNPDGSLDLYVQNENPGGDQEANWLPAPKGAFNLLMRLYAPKDEALTGKWNPPPVTKSEAFLGLGK